MTWSTKRLDRQLGALRLLDHANDAGEHGVGADARRAEGEGAGRVDRGAGDGRARRSSRPGVGSPVIIDSST